MHALRRMHEQSVGAQQTLQAYEQGLSQREQIVRAQQEALERRQAEIDLVSQEVARQQQHIKSALGATTCLNVKQKRL